jgi:hypothetical protein
MIPRCPSPPAGLAGVLVAVLICILAAPAEAHLMPAGQGTLNVVGDAVFAVVSVPVSALHGFDDDGDGLLSMAEMERHQDALRAEIDARFALSDGDVAGRTVTLDVVLSPQHDSAADRADQLVALKHVRFAAHPTDLRLTCDLSGTRPEDRQITITATQNRGPDAEVAVFAPGAPEHRFFRPLGAAIASSVRLGVERVLGGPARLLFLLTVLTVIAVGLGWGYRRGLHVAGSRALL